MKFKKPLNFKFYKNKKKKIIRATIGLFTRHMNLLWSLNNNILHYLNVKLDESFANVVKQPPSLFFPMPTFVFNPKSIIDDHEKKKFWIIQIIFMLVKQWSSHKIPFEKKTNRFNDDRVNTRSWEWITNSLKKNSGFRYKKEVLLYCIFDEFIFFSLMSRFSLLSFNSWNVLASFHFFFVFFST